MKREAPLLILGLVILLAYRTDGNDNDNIEVVSSTNEGVVLEVRCSNFITEERAHDGVLYRSVTLPDFGLTEGVGKPQVPLKGTLVAVPPSGDVDMEITESDFEVYPDYNPYPAPRPVLRGDEGDQYVDFAFEIDSEVYGRNAFFPGELAKIEEIAFMRDQRVARVNFFPIQINPVTGKLHFYTRLRVKLAFGSSDEVLAAKATVASRDLDSLSRNRGSLRAFTSNSYERMLNQLVLNYGSRARRQTRQHPATRADAAASPGTSDIVSSSTLLASGPRFKISVDEDGIYIITYDDLVNAGMNLSVIDPRRLTMTNQGEEVAIYITGEDDGVFDNGDYILFFGTAMTGPFTDMNVYWLYESTNSGLRMTQRDGSLSGNAQIPDRFRATVHAEENVGYGGGNPSMYNEEDYWWWDFFIAPGSHDYSISLNNISNTGGQAELRVRLNGGTGTSTNPDHHTQILLNGKTVDDAYWDGIVEYTHIIDIPQADLQEGVNTVRIQGVGDTGSNIDIFFSNWIEMDYFRRYVAEDDVLDFSSEGPGTFELNVTGFTNNDIQVFDVSDAKRPVRITNYEIAAANPSYVLKFEDLTSSNVRYIALTGDRKKAPRAILVDEPTDLKSSRHGADYIIITYDDFYDAIQRLADYRENQGLRVKTVKIADIYDEFSYGVFDPRAIQYFLKYAYENWEPPAPLYVLLVGDANYDYKNYAGTGVVNYVPTLLEVTRLLGLTGTDNPFACVSGNDAMPDIFLGRIPVKSNSDLDVVINKIMDYETTTPSGDWNRNVFFAADNNDTAGDFVSTLDALIADFLPSEYNALKVYYDYYVPDVNQARQDIISYINLGAVITNYLGHGGVDIWAREKLLQTSDIPSLDNQDRLTFLSVSSCYNGFFQNPRREGLAEELLRASNGGAVGAWAATGLSYLYDDKVMTEELFTQVFQEGNNIMGAACTAAKVRAHIKYGLHTDDLTIMEYFGDPLLELATIREPGIILTSPVDGTSTALDQTVSLNWKASGVEDVLVEIAGGGDVSVLGQLGEIGVSARRNSVALADGEHGGVGVREYGSEGVGEYESMRMAQSGSLRVWEGGGATNPLPHTPKLPIPPHPQSVTAKDAGDVVFNKRLLVRPREKLSRLVIDRRLWNRIIRMLRRSPSDKIWWRVRGDFVESGEEVISGARGIALEPSTITLKSPTYNDTVPSGAPPTFSVAYSGTRRPRIYVSNNADFPRRQTIRLRVKSDGTSVPSRSRWRRMVSLARANGDKLYWQARSRDLISGEERVSATWTLNISPSSSSIGLIAPESGYELTPDDRASLAWTAKDVLKPFVEFCPAEDFFSSTLSWRASNGNDSLVLNCGRLKKVIKMAEKNEGVAFWRVGGKEAGGIQAKVYSDARLVRVGGVGSG